MTAHRSTQSGVALVEFALVLPLILLLSILCVEFGRAIHEYNIVTQSVRDAARHLTTLNPESGQAQAANLVVYGNTGGAGSPLARGLSVDRVSSSWQVTGTSPAIRIVTVTVTGYAFESMFTTVFGQEFGTLTFPPIQASMRSFL